MNIKKSILSVWASIRYGWLDRMESFCWNIRLKRAHKYIKKNYINKNILDKANYVGGGAESVFDDENGIGSMNETLNFIKFIKNTESIPSNLKHITLREKIIAEKIYSILGTYKTLPELLNGVKG